MRKRLTIIIIIDFLFGLFNHYYAPFYFQAIDCVKDVITRNSWQNLAGVSDVKSHHLVKCTMTYGSRNID